VRLLREPAGDEGRVQRLPAGQLLRALLVLL
jgi:hypothetical protein